jgi:hypothetical protein
VEDLPTYDNSANANNSTYKPINLGKTSDTGLNGVSPRLSNGQTLAIEGMMDSYDNFDYYKFTLGSTGRITSRVMWATGRDDIDFFLWDPTASGTLYPSQSYGIDSEPGGAYYGPWPTLAPFAPATVLYVGTYMWMNGNQMPNSTGQYVIIVKCGP